HKFDQAAKDPFFGNVQVGAPNHPTSFEGSPTTSPLAAPSPCCTLSPSDRVIPKLSPVHRYMQHPSQSAPLPLHNTVHVSITG
ncbi:hypothetical protein EDB86DRAFT_2804066, partial [Lactarius hatsudake]